MRKHEKKQILELLNTLQDACIEIQKLVKNNETQLLSNLVEDCWHAALSIGNSIEESEGDGITTISYLEEYCELLYSINEEIFKSTSDNKSITGNKLIRDLIVNVKNKINTAKNSVINDIKVTFEIAFLPYKASMFDSMESIWIAANNDPQCDAYVVPIPFYDKLNNGSLGKVNYEGNDFPDYVPITDWQSYQIDKRHPDAIIIHNPYDEWNKVTSIHPVFYSERLKNYTDLLVYTPYFVFSMDVDNLNESFCILPGTLYATKVITQSEKIRKKYIEIFRKELTDIDGIMDLNKKFLALGSCKFDKVINSKREDYKLPEKWLRLINGKKVLLYNTSLTSTLGDTEKYLKKLRSVLCLMKEQKDIVLWWRPHPLSESTYRSMRSSFSKEYLEIVEEYKKSSWGIYDDSSDLHRAIAYSDAYYGDSRSSLKPLYQCSGKPILCQNIETTSGKYPILQFSHLCDTDDNLWFMASNYNSLFKINKQTLEIEHVGYFPNEDLYTHNLYSKIIEHNNKLYFTPYAANEIAIYDIKTNTFEKVEIAKPECIHENILDQRMKFGFTVKYKESIFFIARSYPAILRFNTENFHMDFYTDWVTLLGTSSMECYFASGTIIENHLILPAANTNMVIDFNMDTCSSSAYEVGGKECNYKDICFDGKDCWLLPRNSKTLVKWNYNTKLYKEYNNYPNGFEGKDNCFTSIAFFNGYVWLFPSTANMSLKIDIVSEKITVADIFQDECEYEKGKNNGVNYVMSFISGDKIYVRTAKTNRIIEYNFIKNERRESTITFSENDLSIFNEYYMKIFNKNPLSCLCPGDCSYNESNLRRLITYTKYVINDSPEKEALSKRQLELVKDVIVNPDGSTGSRIYSTLKEIWKKKS